MKKISVSVSYDEEKLSTLKLYLATKIGSEVVYFDKQVFNAS